MKKRYTFLPKNWLRCGLTAAFATALSFNLQAQVAPAKQWDKTFGGSEDDVISSIRQTPDGGYILGGYSNSAANGDKTALTRGKSDFWVVKLDAAGNKQWDKAIGADESEDISSLELTSDGGYIMAGRSNSPISGDKTSARKGLYDYWVVKLDAAGTKQWDKTYGGSGTEYVESVLQTPDGGYLIGGISDSGISGDKTHASKGYFDYWIVKLDANGNKLWDKAIGSAGDDYLGRLIQTSDQGFMLAGETIGGITGDKTQANKGHYDYWIVKLNSSGTKQWDKSIGGSGWDHLTTVKQTSDGGYIVGGDSQSGIGFDKTQANKGDRDYWVIKLDATGNKQWDKTFGGAVYDSMNDLIQTPDNGFIIIGNSTSGVGADKSEPSKGGQDSWVIKLDANGNKLWDKTIGGNLSDNAASLDKTADGGFVFGGSSTSDISGDKSQASRGKHDFWAVKFGAASPTGIKEPEATLSIYPNPVSNFLHLPATAKYSQLTVSDLSGKVLLRENKPANRIDLSTFSAGIYIVSLQQENKVQHVRIIKE